MQRILLSHYQVVFLFFFFILSSYLFIAIGPHKIVLIILNDIFLLALTHFFHEDILERKIENKILIFSSVP